ncbi:MAG: hypothetical protein ABIO36_03730 [Pyrinomonadaceae bacterium]
MWIKLYLAALGLSITVMAFFTYYSWSWLQSIGLPSVAVAGYVYHSNLSWVTLWISAAALLIVGNAVVWANGRALALWATFLYFAVFVIIRYFWIDESFLHYRKTNGLVDGSFSVGPFFAVILIPLAGVIVFFDKFLVIRLRAKTYPETDKAHIEHSAE